MWVIRTGHNGKDQALFSWVHERCLVVAGPLSWGLYDEMTGDLTPRGAYCQGPRTTTEELPRQECSEEELSPDLRVDPGMMRRSSMVLQLIHAHISARSWPGNCVRHTFIRTDRMDARYA